MTSASASAISASATSAPQRRADVDRAYAHLATLATQADVSAATDPVQQWVIVLRHFMKRYGEVGEMPALDDVRVAAVSADGVPAEWVTAHAADPQRRIVYVHGGGWAGGSPLEYRQIAATLSRFSGASVLVPDYRLSPEHRFPAGLDDCARALDWARSNGPDAESAGREAQAVALAGDSAGANLAAAACLLAVKNGRRVPDHLVLIAGTLDNAGSPQRVGIDDPIATPDALAVSVAAYLRPGDEPTDPRVSPVYAAKELLARFPPTLIQVSRSETLLYDSRRFAQRLEDAGVRTVLSIWPDLPHVWHSFLGLLPESFQALSEIGDFVKPHRAVVR